MRVPPFSVDEHRLDIVVGIGSFITGRAIANLEIHHLFRRFVYEVMGVARPGSKARAHTWAERGLALVGDERRGAPQHVDELILSGVGVA